MSPYAEGSNACIRLRELPPVRASLNLLARELLGPEGTLARRRLDDQYVKREPRSLASDSQEIVKVECCKVSVGAIAGEDQASIREDEPSNRV